MILYEYEGKELLSKAGIKTPKGQLLDSSKDKISMEAPFVLKAQTLSGRRGKQGGVIMVKDKKDATKSLGELFGNKINKEEVKKILVEEAIDHKEEFYLSVSYDTYFRAPVLSFSKAGGISVEDAESQVFPIDPANLENQNLPSDMPYEVKKIIPLILTTFFENDCTLLEINPLVIANNGKIYALDAKIKLDDTAASRHPEWAYPPRAVSGHTPTKREVEAKKIDEGDYRGTAGATFFDLPGDIAVLASGGGGSLTAMDALLKAEGSPANYTEYSGNPPKEKVNKLAKIVLSKDGINGLWIVGAVANFTDIYETLSGFLEALRKVTPKPTFPIVIRRGGPRDKEAFEMLRKVKDFDLHLYGSEISITESAKIMAELAKKYATSTKGL